MKTGWLGVLLCHTLFLICFVVVLITPGFPLRCITAFVLHLLPSTLFVYSLHEPLKSSLPLHWRLLFRTTSCSSPRFIPFHSCFLLFHFLSCHTLWVLIIPKTPLRGIALGLKHGCWLLFRMSTFWVWLLLLLSAALWWNSGTIPLFAVNSSSDYLFKPFCTVAYLSLFKTIIDLPSVLLPFDLNLTSSFVASLEIHTASFSSNLWFLVDGNNNTQPTWPKSITTKTMYRKGQPHSEGKGDLQWTQTVCSSNREPSTWNKIQPPLQVRHPMTKGGWKMKALW